MSEGATPQADRLKAPRGAKAGTGSSRRAPARRKSADEASSAAPGLRARKLEATRQALLRAATAVVGDVGYEKASIARITSKAKVAQGTFYTYFESRQALFDRLLPDVGLDLLGHIAKRLHGASDIVDVESRALRAMFGYVSDNPGFYRLLNEAETLAPKAHKAHFQNVAAGYLHSLERAWERGELRGYERREIEVLAYLLMGMRSYLMLGYARKGKRMTPLPEWVAETYVKFVSFGLTHGPSRGKRTEAK